MKIILQKDVPHVGRKYDVKAVSDGYAVNFLLPRKLAVFANPQAIAKAAREKETRAAAENTFAEQRAKDIERLAGQTVTIKAKASGAGGLFAGIDAEAIARAVNDTFGTHFTEEHIILPKPIKETGEHVVSVEAGDARVRMTVAVVPAS